MLIENFRPGTLERLGPAARGAAGAQPEARHHPHHRLRARRAVRDAPGIRHHRRGDERLRRDQRRARRGPVAATDRAHRRGHRARRRVRHDGRRALRRRPGRRRQPARVALPAHGSADRRAPPPRLRATPHGVGHPLLGASRHLPVRRRQVGRDLDVGRVGRVAGDGARRPRRRPAVRDLRRARRASRRGRSRRARVDRRPLLRRGARRLRDRAKPRSLPS